MITVDSEHELVKDSESLNYVVLSLKRFFPRVLKFFSTLRSIQLPLFTCVPMQRAHRGLCRKQKNSIGL